MTLKRKLIFFLFLFLILISFVSAENVYIDFTGKTTHTWTFPPAFNVQYLGYSESDWVAISLLNSSFISNSYVPTDISYISRINVYQAVNGWVAVDITKSNASLKTTGLYALNTEETPVIVYDIQFNQDILVYDIRNIIVNFVYSNNEGGTLYGAIALLNDDEELTSSRNQSGLVVGNYKNMTFSYNDTAVFNRMIFGLWNADTGTASGFEYLVKGITLNDVFMLNDNVLPSVNKTNIPTLCINDTQILNLSVDERFNISDNEGDTIYYAISETAFNISDTIFMGTTSCILGYCVPFPNYNEFIENVFYPYNETCLITDSVNNLFDDTKHNFVAGLDATSYNTYLLALDSDCLGTDKAVYYSFAKSSSAGNIQTEWVGLEIDEGFNITLLPDGLDAYFFDLIIERYTNGTYFFYKNNSGSKTFLMNFTGSHFFRVTETNIQNSSLMIVDVVYSSTGLSLDETITANISLNPDNTQFKNIRFGINDGTNEEVYLSMIDTNLEGNTFVWKTYLDDISISHAGMYNYVTRITDEAHKDFNEYVEIEEWLNILDCDSPYYVAPSNNNNPLNFFNDVLGNSIKEYLEAIGLYELGKEVLYWIWFFLFAGLVLSGFFLTHQLDLTFPLIVSGGLCLILSLMVGYVGNAAVFIIITAFGLFAPIVSQWQSDIGRK